MRRHEAHPLLNTRTLAGGAAAAALAAGIAETQTHIAQNIYQGYHDSHTMVGNPYYTEKPGIPIPQSEFDTVIELGAPRVTIAALEKFKTHDQRRADKERKAAEKIDKEFHQAIGYIKDLDMQAELTLGSEIPGHKQAAADIAEGTFKALNTIMDTAGDGYRDGAQLYYEIVDDETQAKLRKAGIFVKTGGPDDNTDWGQSKFVAKKTPKGTVYHLKFVPMPAMPGDIPPESEHTSGLPTKLEQAQDRSTEMFKKREQELEQYKEFIAAKRIDSLLAEHPEVRGIYERSMHDLQHKPHSAPYSPVDELTELQYATVLKNDAYLRQKVIAQLAHRKYSRMKLLPESEGFPKPHKSK